MTLSEEQIQQLIEEALRGARPPMRRWIGESPRAYDAADAIAEGIAYGVRQGVHNLGLGPKP